MLIKYTSPFYNKVVLDGIKGEILSTPTYVIASDGTSNVANPITGNTSVELTNEIIHQTVFGKRVQDSHIHTMIRRIAWVANTVYTAYDHRSTTLHDDDFYVLSSDRGVYKCISNNNGTASQVEPSSVDFLNFEYVDGYIWRLMFRLSENDLNDLATPDLIPVPDYTTIAAAATKGTIDHIRVDDIGAGYTAVHTGAITDVVSNTQVRIQSTAASADGTYKDSAFFISAGPGAGSIATITNYFSNSSGRYVEFNKSLPTLTINSTYDISPTVQIDGDGLGAVARSIIVNGAVAGVKLLDEGEGYSRATATIVANSAYGSQATISPIISPPAGQTAQAEIELFARHLLIAVTFDGSEIATIPTVSTFCTVGLMQNVKTAANTEVVYSSNTFSNMAVLDTIQVNGNYIRGDIVNAADASNRASMTVVAATANSVSGIYRNVDTLTTADSLVSNTGVIAGITSAVQPTVYLYDAQLLSFGDINTVTRSADTKEQVRFIIRI